jgi:hypothetical protein
VCQIKATEEDLGALSSQSPIYKINMYAVKLNVKTIKTQNLKRDKENKKRKTTRNPGVSIRYKFT